MKNLLFICFAILLFGPITANAQVQFQIGTYTATPGATIDVPITVTNFQDYASTQFSIYWDPSVVSLIDSLFHPAIASSNPEIGSTGTFLWVDGSAGCQSIPDGQAILTLRFLVVGAIGSSTSINIDLNQTVEVVDCNTFSAVAYTTTAGSLTVQAPPTSSSPYGMAIDTTLCNDLDLSTGQARICMPLTAIDPVGSGVVGMDFCLDYDETLMTPTGIVNLGNVVLNGSQNASYYINYITDPGKAHVSIYYTQGNAEFSGIGEVACVEFLLNNNVTTGTTADFALCDGTVQESTLLGVVDQPASPGSWTLVDDVILEGRIVFWDDASRPLRYDAGNPSDYLVTEISGTDNGCSNTSPSAMPDVNGYFEYDINNGLHVSFDRDIAGGSVGGACPTDVMPYINGLDVYWAGLVTTFNSTFVPNPFQMIAMDVNMDDRVSAGDITQIQNRIIQVFCEYQQGWNYPSPTQASKDWRFIDQYTVENASGYEVSTSFPNNDGSGYSRSNVPDVPDCLEVKYESLNGLCSYIDSMTYDAVLLGDVNGTWNGNSTPSNVRLETTDKAIFGVCNVVENGKISIPVSFESADPLLALDFTMDYDEQKLNFSGITHGAFSETEFGMAWNNQNEERLLFTSYSKVPGGLTSTEPLFYLDFDVINATITESDFGTLSSYLNGNSAEIEYDLSGNHCTLVGINDHLNASSVLIYPNLVTDQVTIDATNYNKDLEFIALFDTQGRKLQTVVPTRNKIMQLDMSDLPAGMYFIQLDESTRKLIKL